MKIVARVLLLLPLLLAARPARAENGAKLMGLGPASRSMGGTGIAAPREAIGALTANPAAIHFRPRPDETEFGFASTIVAGKGVAKVTVDGESFTAEDAPIFPVATIGAVLPIDDARRWLGGFSMFASGGFGVDYRDSDIDQPAFFDLGGGASAPLVVGAFSRFQALSVAPTLAWAALEPLAFGVQAIATASTLDLGQGSSTAYSLGAQIGVDWRPLDGLLVGASWLTPQRSKFHDVIDQDGDGSSENATIELPQTAAVGVAISPLEDLLVFEVDLKWIGWESAQGFEEMDWADQWVLAFGVEVKPAPAVALRAGYNYAKTPVRRHARFTGTDTETRGGTEVPVYYLETARVIGNPALAQHHITFGVGVAASSSVELHLGFVVILPETLSESGTDILGRPAEIETKVERSNTLELGLTMRF